MSAPAALKAVSHREALSKIVHLLTRDGIPVVFRGSQPMVQTRGNKAIRMILPELNDSAPPELLDAIHGYLDHEYGHIRFTPFATATNAGKKDPKAPALINIVEDIRLEKLLPRELPGTKENLERMYERFIPNMLDPVMREAVATGDPSKSFAGVMVCAMRALAGQKAFQKHMDDNGYWRHFMPLLVKMPNLARKLKEMETFDDVLAIVDSLLDALKPPPPPPAPPPPPPPPPAAPTDCSSDDDDDKDSDDDSEGGEGHGDGSGTDDEEGDDDDTDCSGDADEDAGDEEHEGDGGASGDDAEGEDDGDQQSPDGEDAGDADGEGDESDAGGDSGDADGDADDAGGDAGEDGDANGDGDVTPSDDGVEPSDGKTSDDGKNKSVLQDALKELDPAQRKALFMYKQRKQSVADIATAMRKSEDEVLDLLRNARRRLGELMKGAR